VHEAISLAMMQAVQSCGRHKDIRLEMVRLPSTRLAVSCLLTGEYLGGWDMVCITEGR